MTDITLALLEVAALVIIIEYTLRKGKPLVRAGKEFILEVIKAYHEIKSSKQNHNSPHKQINKRSTVTKNTQLKRVKRRLDKLTQKDNQARHKTNY